MSRMERKIPPTIYRDDVTIRVYPFADCKPVAGWIARGMLATVAGIPALSCVVEIDRPPNDDSRFPDYLAAAECILQCGYTKAVAVIPNGDKLAL
jgi:hypothetical protein